MPGPSPPTSPPPPIPYQKTNGTFSDARTGLNLGWSQRTIYISLAALVFVFAQAGIYASRVSSASNFPDDVVPKQSSSTNSTSLPTTHILGHVAEHPIPVLMQEAEEKFRELLEKQSKTLKQAVAEYKKRYGRDPPAGFDKWWEFAVENGVRLVDEFDGLVEDLEPFWSLSGEEFRERAAEAGQLSSIDMVQIRNGQAEAYNAKPEYEDDDISMRGRGFLLMIRKFEHLLPDMYLPVNARSEGRVLVPWELRQNPNITLEDLVGSNSLSSSLFTADWQGRGNVWEAYRRICPPTSPARRLISSKRTPSKSPTPYFASPYPATPGPDFKFARTVDGSLDINYFCENPWAHLNQGLFFSDWRTVPILYPILSPAKAEGFGDVRIPSHYYYGTTRRYTYAWDEVTLDMRALDSMEMPWEMKDEKMFWRGATTGGGSSPPGFAAGYHRHRLVRMASEDTPKNRTVVFADPPSSSNYIFTKIPTSSLNNDVMDVAFVTSVDSTHYPGGLAQEQADHRFDDAALLRDYWAHKYVLDLDGASYSGKFFAYLASDSAVVKASVYKEFWSDWLVPWLHYIPLSSSYKEIYNIHSFFSGPSESALLASNSSALGLPPAQRKSLDGDRKLRRIARAGKQWKKTIGRQVDMEAYVYRLCLEYARLWADDREAASFTL